MPKLQNREVQEEVKCILEIRGIMERHVSPHSAGSGTISEFLDAMECQIVGIVSVVRTTDTVVVGGS